MQSLKQLLDQLWSVHLIEDVSFIRVIQDSRQIREGDVFLALKGVSGAHGSSFIPEAISSGAVAIIISGDQHNHGHMSYWPKTQVPMIYIHGLEQSLGMIANQVLGSPSQSIPVLAVTGTNGKTSTCYITCLLLHAMGKKGGLIGTLGCGIPPKVLHQPFGLTTPSALDVHASIQDLKDHCDLVAIEASSHALDQDRLNGVHIKGAVFTNLSHDHLDYHGSMSAYLRAKLALFRKPSLDYAIVNVDDAAAEEVYASIDTTVSVIAISLKNISNVSRYSGFVTAEVKKDWLAIKTHLGDGVIRHTIIGQHNRYNILSAIAALLQEGYDLQALCQAAERPLVVPGRMECIQHDKGPLVVVDYAHTPDALEQVLSSLKAQTTGQLWVVFGCGGQRDREKRGQMGRIAEQWSDRMVVTNDNPRYESPQNIIDDVLSGMLCAWSAIIEPDRGQAIAETIRQANDHDVIVIAGKGHENIQEIRGEHHYFSDKEHAERYLALRMTHD